MLRMTKEDYEKELRQRIQNGLLTYGGKPFAFTIEVVTEVIGYERHSYDLLPKMWKRKGGSRNSNKENFQKAIRMLPSSITAEYQYKCFCDKRQTETGSSTVVQNGYIITVRVSEVYSSEHYKKYATKGLPFRDKLLSNHKELIRKISGFDGSYHFIDKELVFGSEAFKSSAARFYVTPTGVGTSSVLDVDAHGNLFADYGMCNLNDISECYGFALAIIEIYRPVWEQYGVLDTQIEVIGNSIFVQAKAIRSKPILNSW